MARGALPRSSVTHEAAKIHKAGNLFCMNISLSAEVQNYSDEPTYHCFGSKKGSCDLVPGRMLGLRTWVDPSETIQLAPEGRETTGVAGPLQSDHQLLHRLTKTLRSLQLVHDRLRGT